VSREEPPTSELSLDDRVNAAMKRLGLDADVSGVSTESTISDDKQENPSSSDMNCEGGVCTLPTESLADETTSTTDASTAEEEVQDIESISANIAAEYDVPNDIVVAAIYSSFVGEGDARRIDEDVARQIVQAEVDAISGVPEDCEEVCTHTVFVNLLITCFI
jgi:hypothetical protein